MKRNLALLILVLCALPLVGAGDAHAAPTHDKAYWRAIAANDFAPPSGVPLRPLVLELSGYLASPDSDLRNDIAYNVLTHWLYVRRIVPPDLRLELIDTWCTNLTRGIGEQGTDSVFRRSFSALMLSVIAALDNKHPFLDEVEFRRLLDSALAYLHDEKDTRGFDASKGWVHSVAHTADLLKFLGRSRYLQQRDQAAILMAISNKLGAVDHTMAFGEDERLARAVVSLVARPDADAAAFDAFLRSLKPTPIEGMPTRAQLAVNRNRLHVAVSLYALLAIDKRDLSSAGERVRILLKTVM